MSDEKPEQRKVYTMTVEQIAKVAELAAAKALEKASADFFKYVGKGVLSRVFWVAGAGALAVYFYLQGKGIVK